MSQEVLEGLYMGLKKTLDDRPDIRLRVLALKEQRKSMIMITPKRGSKQVSAATDIKIKAAIVGLLQCFSGAGEIGINLAGEQIDVTVLGPGRAEYIVKGG